MTTINDREWKFLAEQTGLSLPFNDMYYRYLRGLGYTGTLQDMIAASGFGLTPSKGLVPWLPTELSGLQAWLDPLDESTITYRDGTFIAQIADKSGNNNHDSQATLALQPATRDSEGFIFTTGARRMSNPLSAGVSNRWMFGVVKTPISGNRTISGASASGGIQFRLNSSGKPETNRQGVAFRSAPNSAMLVAPNTPTFVGVRYGVGTTDVYYVRDLSEAINFSAGALAASTTISFSNDIGGENLNGGRGGWIIGSGALTTEEIDNIRAYFINRYNAV